MPKRKKIVVLVTVIFAAAVALVMWLNRSRDVTETVRLNPSDSTLIALGKTVYGSECASCHGENLEGEPNWQTRKDDGLLPAPPHDASGHTWHHPDKILFDITKFGVAKAANLSDYDSAMPAYEGVLSDREINAVLSWIKAQWPEEIQTRHDLLNERFRAENGQ